jgi:hypothetical protein
MWESDTDVQPYWIEKSGGGCLWSPETWKNSNAKDVVVVAVAVAVVVVVVFFTNSHYGR